MIDISVVGENWGEKVVKRRKILKKRELRCCVVQKMVITLQPISRHMSC